jgi:two-component system sensor histidine kinase KdpD
VRLRGVLADCGWALLIVAASALCAEVLFRAFDTTRLSMVFLVGVLVAAVRLGTLPGLLAALAAFVVYDFYLAAPRFTLQLSAPEDVLVLFTFLVAALLTGALAGRVRDQAQRATAAAATANALYHASSAFSELSNEEEIRRRLIKDVAQAAHGQAALVDDANVLTEPVDPGLDAKAVRSMALGSRPGSAGEVRTRSPSWRTRPLKAGAPDLGAVAWRSASGGPPSDDLMVDVLIDLGAAAIQRARLSDANARMETLARTEELRSALLSSISHDFRTPLAAITASASSLLELSDRIPPGVREDLLLTIQEEADRLNRFVGNLLNMTRLESGDLPVESEPLSLPEAVQRVWSGCGPRVGARRLQTAWNSPSLALADPVLLEQALSNIVENAIRYSVDGSTILIASHREGRQVVLTVTDEGPGVDPADQQRIFQKFYRTPSSKLVAGTGLGLSIAKGLIEAIGGGVRATSRQDGRPGLSVAVSLPAAA